VQAYAESAPSDVRVIGVAANDSPDAAAAFLNELGVNILAVSDEDGSVTSSIYGFGTLPETVFIDSSGVVRHVVFGGLDRQILRQSVGALR
jgi:peroxiredoxin